MPRARPPLLQKLAGGDRRSIGLVAEVVAEILANPKYFRVVFQGMWADDAIVRMRAADAVEKVTRAHPEYLRPFKSKLFKQAAKIEQQEVRWHAAQLFSRLAWNSRERRVLMSILTEYLEDKSKIVKTFAMQALADLAHKDKSLRPAIIKRIASLTRTGSPAMQSRGRKLLQKLTNQR